MTVELPVTLGVDLGGTRIKWVEWSAAQGVLGSGQIPTPRTSAESVIEAISGVAAQRCYEAIGLGVPGHLSDDGRGIRFITNIPGDWPGLPLATQVEKRVGKPVVLTNDARAFARAELALGAAADLSDALFVTLGTGIGGAIALNGRILRSRGDAFGELGHIICQPDGPLCGCGAHGCLEAVAGGMAVVARVRALGGNAATPEEVVRAAGLADGVERRTLIEAGRFLGSVVGGVMAYSGVNVVVIGGGVAPAFEIMRPMFETELASRDRLIGSFTVRAAALDTTAGALGAALEANEWMTAHRGKVLESPG